MTTFKERFTKWYIEQGYTFGYDFTGVSIYSDGIFKIPRDIPRSMFNCPFWLKPLLIFFSPSIYYRETVGRIMVENFQRGLRSQVPGIIDDYSE